MHDEITRVLAALGVDEGAPASPDRPSAAAVAEFVSTVSALQAKLKDAEDALELERASAKSRPRKSSAVGKGRGRGSRTSRAKAAASALDDAGGAAEAATADDRENGVAADAEESAVAARSLEESMQTVEDDLARSRRMLEDLDSDAGGDDDADDDVLGELERLREEVERVKREKEDAVAQARVAPSVVRASAAARTQV